MAACPVCSTHVVRVHRSWLERLLYADVYQCHRCKRRIRRWRTGVDVLARFVFSRHSRCIQCASERVERMAKRDRIDSVSNHVLSLLQGLTGAPLNRCPACRLQYRDWRSPERTGA